MISYPRHWIRLCQEMNGLYFVVVCYSHRAARLELDRTRTIVNNEIVVRPERVIFHSGSSIRFVTREEILERLRGIEISDYYVIDTILSQKEINCLEDTKRGYPRKAYVQWTKFSGWESSPAS